MQALSNPRQVHRFHSRLWQWQHSRRADGSSTTPDDSSRYTIEFLASERFTARADCNQLLGTYRVDGAQLTLELGPMTLVGCPPDRFGLVGVQPVQRPYTRSGDELRIDALTSAGGETQLTFVVSIVSTSE